MNNLELSKNFIYDSKEYCLYLMNNESLIEQELFLESFYKSFGFRKQLDIKWLNWFYNNNPLGLCNNYILIDIEKVSWIGGFGYSKVAYLMNGIKGIGGLGINGFINPEYEGKGLYTKLISLSLEADNPNNEIYFSFPHKNNLPSIKGHLKSGWKNFISLTFLEINIEVNKLIFSDAICVEQPENLKYLDFELFNDNSSLSFIRNFDFLYWRFITRPNKTYKYLQIKIGMDIGYMVLGFYEKLDGTKRCQIIDYRTTSELCLSQLIYKAYEVAILNKCMILDVLINPASVTCELYLSLGFIPRNEGYELLTFSKLPVKLQNEMLITYGDFDTV